jgi:hypothetical protein
MKMFKAETNILSSEGETLWLCILKCGNNNNKLLKLIAD